jgi:phage FluMu protein Com
MAQDVADLKEKPLREFYQDFRGGRSLNSSLKLIGPDVDAVTKQEDLGLRITLPKDRAVNGGVAVMTLFSLAGDFEVTGSYELLSADQPAKGYGVGVSLNLETNEARDKFAKVARAMRVKDGSVYVTEYWRNEPPKDYKTFSVKTEARAGKLRLVRAGSKICFLVADGAGNDFREIKQQEFGTDDIADVRFVVADSGSPGNAVDARLIDLKIRASKLSPDPVAAGGPAADGPVKSADRGWLVAALLIGAAIIVFVSGAAAAAIFLWRRRRAVQAPSGNQPAATEAASPIVAIACAGCGKQLKAKAELAGKKVKCPQCGKAVAIPAAKATDAE